KGKARHLHPNTKTVPPMRCDLLQRVLNCVGVEPVILVGAMLLVVPSACTAPPPKPMAHYQAVATTNFTPRTEVVRTIEVPVPVPQAATPSLPTSIEPGQFTAVSIPGHRAATVVHGQAQTTRALVYLHG